MVQYYYYNIYYIHCTTIFFWVILVNNSQTQISAQKHQHKHKAFSLCYTQSNTYNYAMKELLLRDWRNFYKFTYYEKWLKIIFIHIFPKESAKTMKATSWNFFFLMIHFFHILFSTFAHLDFVTKLRNSSSFYSLQAKSIRTDKLSKWCWNALLSVLYVKFTSNYNFSISDAPLSISITFLVESSIQTETQQYRINERNFYWILNSLQFKLNILLVVFSIFFENTAIFINWYY